VFKMFKRGSLVATFLATGLVASYAQDKAPKDVTGKWRVTRTLKDGSEELSTLDLKQNGQEVSGTYTGPHGAADLESGRLNDGSLTFSFIYATRRLDASGRFLSDNKVNLTITTQGSSETFDVVASRGEPSSSGAPPLNPLGFLPAPMTRGPLTAEEKLSVYFHRTFGPSAVILPAFGASLGMLNPPNHYPREWKDGPQAFGHLYGNIVATATARETAGMLTSIALHEDPRYRPSSSTNVLFRAVHALSYTVVDRTDSGGRTIAFSNFSAAAAGGLVGMAYLPNGFNDVTHAEQRMAMQFATLAVHNLAAEFQPQWGPIVRKLKIPKLLPEWWVPLH
jgi:hypothetical protein